MAAALMGETPMWPVMWEVGTVGDAGLWDDVVCGLRSTFSTAVAAVLAADGKET
jgi:hypothetical protein